MTDQRSLVAVVDDSESVPDLMQQFGFALQAVLIAEEFLASEAVARTSCLTTYPIADKRFASS